MNTSTLADNSQPNPSTQNQLEQLRDTIKTGHTNLLQHCISLGKHLSAARDLSQDKEGGFIKWVKDELGWSRQYAYNYINVFDTFGELPDEAQNLPIGLTAAIALGRPSTPPEARTEALKIAETGKSISASTARDIIKKHKDLDPERYPERKTNNPTPSVTQFGDGSSKLPASEAQAQHAVRLLIKNNYDNNQEAIAALVVGYPDNTEIARVCQEIQGENTEFKVPKALAQGARNVIKQELQEQLNNKPDETFEEKLSQPLEEIFQPIDEVTFEPDNMLESLHETINTLRATLQSKEEEIKRLRDQLAQSEAK